MKNIKLLIQFLIFSLFAVTSASGQANASLAVLTQNSGLVNQGGTVFIEVTVGNTGPVSPIGAFKVRAQISLPSAFVLALPAAQQSLPPGWTVSAFTGGGAAITVCNGTDVIPVGSARTILIRVQGNNLGGGTVTGNLQFSNGVVCTTPGTLAGDVTADNSSTSSVTVVPASQCTLTAASVSLTGATTIACFGGSTILTANSGQPTNIEYRLNGGAFQTGNTFNVPAGTYTVDIRRISDPACIVTTNTIVVTQPASAVSSTASATNTTATGGNDGTATANPAGGTPGYTYLWSPGGQTTQTATGLTAGTYNVTCTDANGCTANASATVSDPLLPVTLIDFNAKIANCQLALNWITENEINTDRFEIERKDTNSSNWTSAGVVAANGNTSIKTTYQFIEKDLIDFPEELFYRLKIIDKDGRFKYSRTVYQSNNCKDPVVEVYPIPVQKNRLYIKLIGAAGNTDAILISLSGQVILKTKLFNGTNFLNTSNIAAGEYLLNVRYTNGKNNNIKVLIQH